MVFKSQLRRQLIINYLLSWIPDIIIAVVGAKYFDGGYIGFAFIILGLQVLHLVIWMLHSIVQWLVFITFAKRAIQRHLYDYFIINKYPAPDEYESSAEEYLISVMDNKELDPEVRIKAAMEVGTFAAFSGAFEKQCLMKVSIAAEGAIKDYRVWLAGAGLYGGTP